MEEAQALQNAIVRIRRMESRFDALRAAAARNPASIREDAVLWDMWQSLLRYYEGGAWLEDYERDERGEFPAQLKRGVLSEDGVYNLICELEDGFVQVRSAKEPCGRRAGLQEKNLREDER